MNRRGFIQRLIGGAAAAAVAPAVAPAVMKEEPVHKPFSRYKMMSSTSGGRYGYQTPIRLSTSAEGVDYYEMEFATEAITWKGSK